MKAGRIHDLFCRPCDTLKRNNPPVRHTNIRLLFPVVGHDRPTADDEVKLVHLDSDNAFRKSFITAIATRTSASLADSAGLWLMPPLQRTNNIATGQMADIAAASCPAPLASNGASFCCRFTVFSNGNVSRRSQTLAD